MAKQSIPRCPTPRALELLYALYVCQQEQIQPTNAELAERCSFASLPLVHYHLRTLAHHALIRSVRVRTLTRKGSRLIANS